MDFNVYDGETLAGTINTSCEVYNWLTDLISDYDDMLEDKAGNSSDIRIKPVRK